MTDDTTDEDGVEVIDVEAEDVDRLGRIETPNLPAVPDGGRVELRGEVRRADALRIGDEVRAPEDRQGIVTGLWMQPDGWLDLAIDGKTYEVPMDEAVEVVVPQWRPGELLDQISGPRAWGRLDPDVHRALVEAAR